MAEDVAPASYELIRVAGDGEGAAGWTKVVAVMPNGSRREACQFPNLYEARGFVRSLGFVYFIRGERGVLHATKHRGAVLDPKAVQA